MSTVYVIGAIILSLLVLLSLLSSLLWDGGIEGFMVPLMCVPLGLFFVFQLNDTQDKAPTVETYKLRAVDVGTATSGEVLLASGSYQEEAVYRFYQEEAPGRYKLETVNADNVTIVEDGKKEVQYTTTKGLLFDSTTIEIHVPAGSVTSDMDLTLPR